MKREREREMHEDRQRQESGCAKYGGLRRRRETQRDREIDRRIDAEKQRDKRDRGNGVLDEANQYSR